MVRAEAEVNMIFFLQVLSMGLIQGVIYVVIGLSLVVIYKSSQVFNFAVGELATLGGIMLYITYKIGMPLPIILPFFLLLCLLGGFIIEKIVIQPLMGREPLSTTLVTIGLSTFLVGFYQITFGSHPVSLEVNLPNLNLTMGELFFSSTQIWSSIFAFTSIICLLLFYQFTRWGIVMRATAEGQVKAMALGINTHFILAMTWALATVVSGLGGVAVAWGSALTYNMGLIGLVAIPVVLVGGLDSIGGCIIGGFLIGIIEALTSFYLEPATGLSGFRSVTPYLFLLVVLLIRPTGLLGQVRIERV
jgi:branched-chain amino acid transport system permease protein